jgi:hypothetical protein
MVIDGKIIAAARCDLNALFFVCRDEERSAKSDTGSRSWAGRTVKPRRSSVRQFRHRPIIGSDDWRQR